METLIVKNITYGYTPDKPVLKNISFSAEEGVVVSILGPNGAGKSTLLKILLGVLKPWSGEVLFNNRNVLRMNERERARIFSWVPQEAPNIPLSVYEYVLLGRTPHLGFLSQPSRSDERIVEAILENLGLKWAMNRPVNSLSGGEKQLVMIAKALVQESKIILLDEPTSHLDLSNKIRVLKTIKSLREEGLIILFTTHDPNEALLVSDYSLIIHRGELVAYGETYEVLQPEILEKVFSVKLVDIHVDSRKYILPKF